MKVKTLTGSSIQAALAEARRVFGDDVVLLESFPPEGGRPARITVMADEPVRKTEENLRSSIMAVSPTLRGAHQRTTSEAPLQYGRVLQRADSEPVFALEEAAAPVEGFSIARGGYGTMRTGTSPIRPPAAPLPGDELELPYKAGRRGRGLLYPDAPTEYGAAPRGQREGTENLVEAQLRLLNERLKQLESCFGEHIIGASLQWAAHPLFARLLTQGMRPGTVAKLFDRMATRGFTPDAEMETLRWSLAREVRNILDLDAPKCDSGTLVLIGPSGSGKTALALKLARHPSFYGRRRTTVILLQPEPEETVAYQSPIDLYRRFALPVQSVRTAEEMARALERVQKFDQVIIDTPSLPAREKEARKALLHIKRLTDPIMPLQVQLVINATRVIDHWSAAFVNALPLRPGSVALTHLDDTEGWGRIAEWIATLGLPVRCVSNGPRVPDSLIAFSPTWFVEEMMQV